MDAGRSLTKKEVGEKGKFHWKSKRAFVGETSPRGGLDSLGNWPNLWHNPWAGWAAGLCPLPVWMCPVLEASPVAWICLGTAHQVTVWKLERGWNSGWHRWFLLGKWQETFKFPKSKGSAVVSAPPSNSNKVLGFHPWMNSILPWNVVVSTPWESWLGRGRGSSKPHPKPLPHPSGSCSPCAVPAAAPCRGFPGKEPDLLWEDTTGRHHQLGNEL